MPTPSLDLIRGVPLFSRLDDTFLQRLAGEFFEKTFADGEVIAAEGEAGRTFVVIESGEVSVSVQGAEVSKLGPGQAFGEMALIDKSARSATVKAIGPAHCYLLPIWSFRPIVEEHPEMAWSLLESLAQLVRGTQARQS